MINLARSFKNNVFSLLVALLLGLGLVTGFAACGGGSDSGPDNANPNGYYEGTAMVLEEDNNTPLALNDLKAFVHMGKMLIMSVSNVLLYEVEGISVTGDDYSATVTIYKDGVFLTTTTVTGTITEGASLSGTFAGSGAGNGTFTVNYSSVNDSDADLAIIAQSWDGQINGGSFKYEIFNDGVMSTIFQPSSIVLAGCDISGDFLPVIGENLYAITNMELASCTDENVNGTDYNGLATTKTNISGTGSVTENGLMPIAFSNGSFSGTGEIPLD